MPNENVTACLTLILELLIFCARISVSALNQRNVIKVTGPTKGDVWIPGQTSYPITWTQSKFSFKWNIELLDNEENKVADISTGLSEFNEVEMIHRWLVPQGVQSGNYKIKICASASPDDCSSSDLFSIRKSEGKSKKKKKTYPFVKSLNYVRTCTMQDFGVFIHCALDI